MKFKASKTYDFKYQVLSTMSIQTYKYNGDLPTNSAPLVDLVNAGFALLQEINPNTEFGKVVMKSGGDTLQQFLNDLSNIFDNYNVEDSMSASYRLVDDLWFKTREIRGTYEPLNQVTLIPFTEILLKQVRNRVFRLERATMQSEFTAELIDAVTSSLKRFPEQKEKTITVKNKKPNDDGSFDSREVTFFVEPFVDTLKTGFSEGAKAQREYKTQQRQDRANNNKKEKAEGWRKVTNQ